MSDLHDRQDDAHRLQVAISLIDELALKVETLEQMVAPGGFEREQRQPIYGPCEDCDGPHTTAFCRRTLFS